MGRARPRKKEASLFTQFEIEQMKKLSQEAKEQPFNQNFCEKLTKRFNLASGRAGKTPLRWDQVQTWFQIKMQHYPIELSASPGMQKEKEVVVLSDDNVSNSAPENSSAPESCSDIWKGEVPDLSRCEFEARSSKDEAWYDVASFLTHRVLRSGELEARVRFVGFGAEEDEWVKVKKAVRERSLPLEPSECQKVAVGDLVLCFRETSDHATYHDAHIVDIQKRLHDIRGCRCLFLVRYDHDHMEERVPLRKICRRPTH